MYVQLQFNLAWTEKNVVERGFLKDLERLGFKCPGSQVNAIFRAPRELTREREREKNACSRRMCFPILARFLLSMYLGNFGDMKKQPLEEKGGELLWW